MAEAAETTLTSQTNTDDAGGEESIQDAASTEEGQSQKTADEKVEETTEEKVEETEADDSEKAEIEYADFTVPEGMTLDKEALDEFLPQAKELGLDQEKAQKIVDLGSKLVQKAAEAQAKAFEEMQNTWKTDLAKDKELGGNKMNENLDIARKAITQFGTPELKQALDLSGLGDNPEMVRVFYRIGKAISEDAMIKGDATTQTVDQAKLHYPNSDHV